jgi:hypothetical protein
MVFGVDQHGSCRVLEVSDAFLCYRVLEVRVCAAEADGLMVVLTVLHERCFSESPIVGMVVLDLDSVRLSVELKCPLRFERLFRFGPLLKVHKR